MDPFTGIGLASNIVQFLDFSCDLIRGGLKLYRSFDGATSSNSVLEAICKDLDRLCTSLVPTADGTDGHTISELEKDLLPLVEACRSLGLEFLGVLEDLKVKGRHKKLKTVQQILRSTWKARDIQKYEKLLDSYRLQIATRLVAIFT